jgi:hypothetical protein
MLTRGDLEGNLQSYLGGDGANPDRRNSDERYVSFDHCFNYFQSFRESGNVSELANPADVQLSCLQLGFYLASWGMLRGSAGLLQKNANYLIPVIKLIANADSSLWEIDVDCYEEANVQRLVKLADEIGNAVPDVSDTDALKTKIILGVFGSVPGFDTNVSQGCIAEGMVGTFGKNALRKIAAFYQRNASVIDSDKYRVPTLDFISGNQRSDGTPARR